MFAFSRPFLVLGLFPALLSAQSAQILVDINKVPVPTSSHPNPGRDVYAIPGRKFSVWQGKLLIQAIDSKTGFEPYLSDGTQAGSRRLMDLEPGTGSSYPASFTPTRDGKRFFFVATTQKNGRELYVSDGTAKGTRLIEVTPGSKGTDFYGLTAFGRSGVLFFVRNSIGSGFLYRSDGTSIGTKSLGQVSVLYPPFGLDVNPTGTLAYFVAYSNKFGGELWITDGTSKGTKMVLDLYPGYMGSYPSEVTWRADGKAIFAASHPQYGYELWLTDGTGAGTKLVVDFVPGTGSGVKGILPGLLPGKVLFLSESKSLGRELYISDGTAKGTKLLKDIAPGKPSGLYQVGQLISNGKRAWFTRTGPKGKVWLQETDGTPQGTKLFSPRSLARHPNYLIEDQGKLYFDQVDLTPGTGLELCVSDGTQAGTRTLVDLWNGSGSGFWGYPTVLSKGVIAFQGDDGVRGRELWIHRVGKGTSMVDLNRDRLGDTQGSFPLYSAPFGNRALILADDGVHGMEPWISDGTAKGSRLLVDLQKGPASRRKAKLVVVGDRFFYEAHQWPYEPWDLMISDGSVKGTKKLFTPKATEWTTERRAIGRRLFFVVGDLKRSFPWVSDGTPAGTIPLSTSVITQAAGQTHAFAGYGDQVLFVVLQGKSAATLDTMDLWITDGTPRGTRLLKKISTGLFSRWIPRLVTMGGKVYFTAQTKNSSSDLWVSDFTAQGTVPVRLDKVGLSSVAELQARDGTLTFRAWTVNRGEALYRSDGTQKGTRLWVDLAPTGNDPTIDKYQIVGSRRLYFYSRTFRSLGECYHRTDGTARGTLSYDIDPSHSTFPRRILRPHMTALGSQVLISGYTPRFEEEMYAIDNGATAEPLGTSVGPTWLEGSDPVQGAQARIRGGALQKGLTQVLLLGSPSARPVAAGQAGFVYLDFLRYWTVAGVTQNPSFGLSLKIPTSPSLKGAQVVFQTLSFDPRNLNTTLRLSNGLHWTLGQ